MLVFVAHFAGGSNWVMSNYALQGEVPDRLRGRVFATDMMLATLAISVSQLVVAAVVDHGGRADRAGRLRPGHRRVRDRLADRHPATALQDGADPDTADRDTAAPSRPVDRPGPGRRVIAPAVPGCGLVGRNVGGAA